MQLTYVSIVIYSYLPIKGPPLRLASTSTSSSSLAPSLFLCDRRSVARCFMGEWLVLNVSGVADEQQLINKISSHRHIYMYKMVQ